MNAERFSSKGAGELPSGLMSITPPAASLESACARARSLTRLPTTLGADVARTQTLAVYNAEGCATVTHMERVGVRELRQNLSAWLRRVREGEAFEVTDRGEAVALLAPLPKERDPLALLERRGQLARRGDGSAFPVPSLRSSAPTEQILDELRTE